MKETLRYLLGYLVGFTLAVLLVPYALYKVSHFDYLFQGRVLIGYDPARYILTAVAFIIGAVFAAWSNFFLLKIGKGGPTEAFGVSVSPKTKHLVTCGPYAYSRNPMMFGAFSLYASVVILLNSITGMLALILIILIAMLFLRLSEEKRLIKDFGEEYIEYRKNVSMILPFKKRRTKK